MLFDSLNSNIYHVHVIHICLLTGIYGSCITRNLLFIQSPIIHNMTSRKRNKGKERKAKQAKLKNEGERKRIRNLWVAFACGKDPASGLIRGEEDNWEQIIQCDHGVGLALLDDCVRAFMDDFFIDYYVNKDKHLVYNLVDKWEQHPEVWNNDTHREMAIGVFITIGTNFLLLGKDISTSIDITMAIAMLENYDQTVNIATVSCVARNKINNILKGDTGTKRRDLLKFYRKRATSCKCLKSMHLEARKASSKLGVCCHCDEMKERALLMVCSRCRVDQYCSRTCQVAAWDKHKCNCDMYIKHRVDRTDERNGGNDRV